MRPLTQASDVMSAWPPGCLLPHVITRCLKARRPGSWTFHPLSSPSHRFLHKHQKRSSQFFILKDIIHYQTAIATYTMADLDVALADNDQQYATPPTQAPTAQGFNQELFLQRYAEAQASSRQENPTRRLMRLE